MWLLLQQSLEVVYHQLFLSRNSGATISHEKVIDVIFCLSGWAICVVVSFGSHVRNGHLANLVLSEIFR